jgi:putative ABC transport system permease protein
MAMLLVAATAAGVGLLVYAAVATSSTDATSLAKARLTTGGDVRAVLAPNASVRTGIPDSTQVARIRGASLLPSNRGVDVLAIDRSTFLRGAYWRSGFGDRPPRALLDALSPWTARTPVLIAGGTLPTGGILSMGAISLPVREVAALTAFPGMTPGRPVVVVNGPDLERYLHRHGTTLGGVNGGTELWVKGRAGPALARLRAAGVPISDVQTAAGVEGAITFRSLSWTLGFLESLGILAAIVAVATTLLYLQAMQRSRDVSYALATRMGLSRRAHRRAVAFELAGMLTVAFVVGLALALGAAMLVLSRLDLVPQIPPAPFLQIPLATIVAVIAALAAVAVAGSVWAQRTADRTKVAEVMRLAT